MAAAHHGPAARRELDARQHAIGKPRRRLFPPQRDFQFIIQPAHRFTIPIVRATFSRRIASDRCNWLFTVPTGMSQHLRNLLGLQILLVAQDDHHALLRRQRGHQLAQAARRAWGRPAHQRPPAPEPIPGRPAGASR